MGAFDDLIPRGQQASSKGAFDDLIPQQQENTPPPQERGLGEEALRQLGLTARAGLEAFGGSGPMFGLPQPESETERYVNAAARGIAGAAGITKLSSLISQNAINPVVQGVTRLLADKPVTSMAMGGLSTTASQAAEESGASPMMQTVAGIAAPVAASFGGSAIVRPVATKVGNILHNAFAPTGAKQAAGRVMGKVSGPDAAQVAQDIKGGAKEFTAGQSVAAGASRKSEVVGLERAVGKTDPSSFDPRHGTIATAFENSMKAEKAALSARLYPKAERVLNALEQKGGVNVNPIIKQIDDRLLDKKDAANDAAKGLLNYVKKEIDGLPDTLYDKATGQINPHTLYGVRKQLGLKWKKLANSNDWDKGQAAVALRDAQKYIDDVLIAAEGKTLGTQTWKTDYLDPMAKGFKNLDELKAIPKAAQQMGAFGSSAARQSANLDRPEISFSNFLSRPIMILNAVARNLQGQGSEKTMKELARLMRPENKAELAKLMEEEIARTGRREGFRPATARGAIVGSAVQSAQTPDRMINQ